MDFNYSNWEAKSSIECHRMNQRKTKCASRPLNNSRAEFFRLEFRSKRNYWWFRYPIFISGVSCLFLVPLNIWTISNTIVSFMAIIFHSAFMSHALAASRCSWVGRIFVVVSIDTEWTNKINDTNGIGRLNGYGARFNHHIALTLNIEA